jgi:tRNA pseudouridine38-40 synthase
MHQVARMFYYKATIQYEGTNYAGFQWQNGLVTVQSELKRALYELVPGKVTTRGASRTDTGVHAFEQIIKITSENSIDEISFVKSFNQYLPRDIRCLNFTSCSGEFIPGLEATSKEYRYFFTNKKRVSKEENTFVANMANELNVKEMMKCVQALIGEHNFCNFYSAGSNVKSTTREIYHCEITQINPHEVLSHTDLFQIPVGITICYQLRIEANGFLKQMIRHIVSALWMVGSGKISSEEFMGILNGPKSEHQRWKVAPPNGLFLYRINYR